jgi:hypothetical protein
MEKTKIEHCSEIDLDYLVNMVRQKLLNMEDPRNRSIGYSFHDLVMSGFAMFHFKFPSMHNFATQTVTEQANLGNLFKISNLCTDTHLRNHLDQINPESLRELYPSGINLLNQVGILKSYKYKDYLICSIDGVQHFSSKEVHCEHCLTKKHRDGTVTYHHNMLCAALVHPNEREVFIMGSEPIINQDGASKNDCEINASKRLLPFLVEHYKEHPLLIVEDALYATGPNLRLIKEQPKWDFIVNIKPDSQKVLFKAFEARKQRGQVHSKKTTDKDGTTHRFWYANNFALNDSSGDVRVNVLFYEEEKKDGTIKKFSWATSLKLSWRNVQQVMRAGRSRWKIENEIFNTLKNQGYHFEHNFGHGFKYLHTFFAYLMLLAFQTDQIFQRCSRLFNRIRVKAKTNLKLWGVVKSIFTTTIVYSFKELYIILAREFRVQLE